MRLGLMVYRMAHAIEPGITTGNDDEQTGAPPLPDEANTGTAVPDGWEVRESAGAYWKLVREDAVEVPKQYSGDGPFQRDAVVIAAPDTVGIVKGPAARTTWASDEQAVDAVMVARVLDEWISDGNGPYADANLEEQLASVMDDGGDA